MSYNDRYIREYRIDAAYDEATDSYIRIELLAATEDVHTVDRFSVRVLSYDQVLSGVTTTTTHQPVVKRVVGSPSEADILLSAASPTAVASAVGLYPAVPAWRTIEAAADGSIAIYIDPGFDAGDATIEGVLMIEITKGQMAPSSTISVV